MNAQNFTQKTIEAVQTAQSMAQENRNSYITPEHLLYALVDQDGGLIPTLFKRMGVDCDAVLSELDGAIAALPKVGGDSSEVYMSSELSRVLSAAEKAAKSMGDEYLSVEHLMIGIFAAGTAATKRILADHGITKSAFTTELLKVKSAPVTVDIPERTYDVLTKYDPYLVQRAFEKQLELICARCGNDGISFQFDNGF